MPVCSTSARSCSRSRPSGCSVAADPSWLEPATLHALYISLIGVVWRRRRRRRRGPLPTLALHPYAQSPGRRGPDQRCHVDDTVIEMHSWTLARPAGRPPPTDDRATGQQPRLTAERGDGRSVGVVLGSADDRTSGQSGAGRGLEEGLRFYPGAGSGVRTSWASLKLNRSLVRFASSHPVRYSLASAVLIAPWIGFLFRHIVYGLLAGLVMFALQLTLWVPGGAMRQYCERKLENDS